LKNYFIPSHSLELVKFSTSPANVLPDLVEDFMASNWRRTDEAV
jgi:hypothetical protein